MNPFWMIVSIVFIVTVGQIVKTGLIARHGSEALGRHRRSRGDDGVKDAIENKQLRDEVKLLKDRIQTLERIAVDKENSLANEIEQLRDR